MKTVVAFQGGGALGAFGGVAWAHLAPWLRERGDVVVALAGGSIGALNAAVVAHLLDEPDWGRDELSSFWRERIATPACPFFGWSFADSRWARRLRSWNGFMSGVLVGNQALYVPSYGVWNPWQEPQRLASPLFDRQRMQALLRQVAPAYRSDPAHHDALLVVSATELMSGELHLFDSDDAEIKPRHLLASAALPMLFEPVRIGAGLYWDGEAVRQSMLRPTIHRLRQSEKFAASELDEAAGIGRWIRIARGPLPHDAISGQFDYSPERVDELIGQGHAAARDALEEGGLSDPPAWPLRTQPGAQGPSAHPANA